MTAKEISILIFLIPLLIFCKKTEDKKELTSSQKSEHSPSNILMEKTHKISDDSQNITSSKNEQDSANEEVISDLLSDEIEKLKMKIQIENKTIAKIETANVNPKQIPGVDVDLSNPVPNDSVKKVLGLVFPVVENDVHTSLFNEFGSACQFIWERIKQKNYQDISRVISDLVAIKNDIKKNATMDYIKQRGLKKYKDYFQLREDFYKSVDDFVKYYNSSKDYNEIVPVFRTMYKSYKKVIRFRPGTPVPTRDGRIIWILDK